MKIEQIKFLLFIVILFITFHGYPKNLEDLPPKVKEYVSKLNSFRENITVTKEEFIGEIEPEGLQQVDMLQLTLRKVSKKIEHLSNEEFKQLVKLRNEAIEEDSYKLNEYFGIDGRETSKLLDINSNNIIIKLAVVDKMVLDRISKMYDEVASGIHRTPILAKVTIIDSNDEIYESEGIKFRFINYDAIVEDICRGNNILDTGIKITFYIIPQWWTAEYFEKGKSYFIGCATIIDDFGKKRLQLWNNGIHPLENNKIIDRNNTFNIGNEMLWDNFKIKMVNILNLNY